MASSGASDAALISRLAEYTKTGPTRLGAMMEAIRRVDREKVPGAIVECGVWRGGNIILARCLSPHRVCWLYDTFCGMPEPGVHDVSRKGLVAWDIYQRKVERGLLWADASIAEVRACLAEMGVLDDQFLRFVEGDVAETLKDERNLPAQIAICRLDTDWYASTKIELEVLFPRIADGGILIVDDFGHWLGARKALADYLGPVRVKRLQQIDYTAVMLVKGA